MKTIHKKNLYKYNTYISDNSNSSPDYFDIQNLTPVLSSGLNSFLIHGNFNTLKTGTPIHIELLDYNGNPIYYEVSKKYQTSDNYRLVSVYIYPNQTSAGTGTLTIVGTVDRDKNGKTIPSNWTDKINVKWTKKFTVDLQKRNDSDIVFEDDPILHFSEKLRKGIRRSYNTIEINNISLRYYHTAYDDYGTVIFDDNTILNSDILQDENNKLYISGSNVNSDYGQDYTTLGQNEQISFAIAPPPTSYEETVIYDYSGSIDDIITKDTAITIPKYKTYNEFITNDARLIYRSLVTEEESGIISSSFCMFNFKNLNLISGDVHKLDIFYKRKSSIGDYEFLNSVIYTPTELYYDSGSLTLDKKIGYFTTQSIYDDYFEYIKWDSANYGVFDASVDNSELVDHVNLNPDVPYDGEIPFVVKNRDEYKLNFYEKNQYEFHISYKAVPDVRSSPVLGGPAYGGYYPKLKVYISGSSFNYDSDAIYTSDLYTDKKLGKKIAEIDPYSNTSYNQKYSTTFISDKTGDGVLHFAFEGGIWDIGEISITSISDFGMSPNHVDVIVETPQIINKDYVDFKIEYFDYKSTKSKNTTYIKDVYVEGGTTFESLVKPDKYLHEQTIPSNYWHVTHSLNSKYNQYEIIDNNSQTMRPLDILHSTVNDSYVDFGNEYVTGYALVTSGNGTVTSGISEGETSNIINKNEDTLSSFVFYVMPYTNFRNSLIYIKSRTLLFSNDMTGYFVLDSNAIIKNIDLNNGFEILHQDYTKIASSSNDIGIEYVLSSTNTDLNLNIISSISDIYKGISEYNINVVGY